MSKQLEAELRADKQQADAAVDVAMGLLDEVCKAAIGARTTNPSGSALLDRTFVMVPVPFGTMGTISTAVNLWRKSKGTVQ